MNDIILARRYARFLVFYLMKGHSYHGISSGSCRAGATARRFSSVVARSTRNDPW